MSRAHRHFLPGYIWHITQRCHRQQFLLKFYQDRQTWIRWLYEARKRYGLQVLNYTVTSNHVHLLVRDTGENDISASMQLISGRVAQQYNQRKSRHGAFWEDRYHATAVQSGSHLARCLVYVDLNMVRAGVVQHPADWPHGGFHEIQTTPNRYRIIDIEQLCRLLEFSDIAKFRTAHLGWIATALQQSNLQRESVWTEAVAVGETSFLEAVKHKIQRRSPGRSLLLEKDVLCLRESREPYRAVFRPKNPSLSSKKADK